MSSTLSGERMHERRERAKEQAKMMPRAAELLGLVRNIAHLSHDDMVGPHRERKIVAARRAFAVLARNLPPSYLGHARPSFPEVARLMGMPSHSTAIESHDSAYRDPAAVAIIQSVCNMLDVPAADRPICRTPEMPRMERKTAARMGQGRSRLTQHMKHERSRQQEEMRMKCIEAERKAEQILTALCKQFGVARSLVTSRESNARATKVRWVFACIVRDTDACGGLLVNQEIAEIAGRDAHPTVATWRRLGKERAPHLVREACAKLGITPPAYAAAKEGAA